MDHGSVAFIGLVVACGDAAGLLETTEVVFDEMTPFVHVKVASNPACPAGLGRDDGAGAAPVEFGPQPIIVKGLVAEQRREFDVRDQGFGRHAVVALARQKNEAHEIAERIDQSDDLGRQAAARSPDFESPFCAGAMLVDPDDGAVDERVFEIRIAR